MEDLKCQDEKNTFLNNVNVINYGGRVTPILVMAKREITI